MDPTVWIQIVPVPASVPIGAGFVEDHHRLCSGWRRIIGSIHRPQGECRMTIAASTQLICFLVLSAVVVLGALGVVLLSNIVYSAFLLGGVFLAVAGLYLLLNASFVAAAQVLVYVGAENVLILFAIMLVNKREDLEPIPGLTTRRLLSGGV